MRVIGSVTEGSPPRIDQHDRNNSYHTEGQASRKSMAGMIKKQNQMELNDQFKNL